MGFVMLGGGGGGGHPFNRTFFNVALGDILGRNGKGAAPRLTVYLVDGTILNVSEIEEVSDQYLVIRAYLSDDEGGEKSLNVVPYAAIYRMEVSSGEASAGRRLGFHWAAPVRRGIPSKKPLRKADGPLSLGASQEE